MRNNNNKWARGLNKKLVRKIFDLEPLEVSFLEMQPRYTECSIHTPKGVGRGRAICSILDKFDLREGKNKAAGRAVKAIEREDASEPIREELLDFPNSWTKKQILRVLDNPFYYKSEFYEDR